MLVFWGDCIERIDFSESKKDILIALYFPVHKLGIALYFWSSFMSSNKVLQFSLQSYFMFCKV